MGAGRGDSMTVAHRSRHLVVSMKDQIYDTLKSAILSNECKPGDILQIDKLAKEFGVSATPIRETLMRLEGTGLLKIIPNKGAQITEINIHDVRDIWEMRILMEPYAGKKSAKRISDDEILKVIRDVQDLQNRSFDGELYIKVDNDLHSLLFRHVENDYLYDAIERIQDHSLRIRYYAETSSADREKVVCQVCAEHLEILEALRLHDPEKAEVAIRRHLENGEKRTLAAVSRIIP
jgi:DNA-binding GntR family transcriptional regulator